MVAARAGGLLSWVAQVPDPRGRKGRRHPLPAMLTAVVCGVLCGVRGWTDLAEWLHEQGVDVWHWMGFTRRPPKKDAFRDLLIRLDPQVLERAVREWVERGLGLRTDSAPEGPAPAGPAQPAGVSLDGKTLCATLRPFAAAVQLLAAVDHRTGCVLGQCRVAAGTNEHKAALDLLKSLALDGRVVLGDAAFCQRDLCEQVLAAGGDYLLPVKENQPALLRAIECEFAAQDAAFSPLHAAAAAG